MYRHRCRSKQRSALPDKLLEVGTRKVRRSLDLQRRKQEATKAWNSRSLRSGEGWWDLWQERYPSNKQFPSPASERSLCIQTNTSTDQTAHWSSLSPVGRKFCVSARISLGMSDCSTRLAGSYRTDSIQCPPCRVQNISVSTQLSGNPLDVETRRYLYTYHCNDMPLRIYRSISLQSARNM